MAGWRSDVPTCWITTTSGSRNPAPRGQAAAPLEANVETWLSEGRTVLRVWTSSVAPRRKSVAIDLRVWLSRCVVRLARARQAAKWTALRRTRPVPRPGNRWRVVSKVPVLLAEKQRQGAAAAAAAAAARGGLVVAGVRAARADRRGAPSKPATRLATRASTTAVSRNVEPARTISPVRVCWNASRLVVPARPVRTHALPSSPKGSMR